MCNPILKTFREFGRPVVQEKCSYSFTRAAPIITLVKKRLMMKKTVRCSYLKACYLAEELECYGFKTNCALYMRANDEPCNGATFDAAMDELILRTKQKHDRLKRSGVREKPKPVKSHSTSSTT